MSSASDFVIENGVLKKYTGPGGDVVIPEGVTSIGKYAFLQCSSLASVTIPEGVTSIGNEAFRGCSSLTSVTIPEGVTSIGRGAFFGCESLKSVTIPESVTSIGSGAFYGCAGLQDAQGLVIVGGVLYYCVWSAVNVTIPEGVTSIGSRAFYECKSLTSVTIPKSVTSIGSQAFSGCSSLTSVTIPEGVTSIGNWTFENCSRLTSVTIPEGVTSIGKSAFSGCESLKSVTIPKSVTNIGQGAFCTALARIQLPLAALQFDLFGDYFGGSVKNAVIADVRMPDGGSKRVVAAFRSGGSEKKRILKKTCLAPLEKNDIPHYDRLAASGSYDGFSLNQTERVRAALWRLEDTEFPVADDARSDMIKLIKTMVIKIIAFADEENAPYYIQTLIDVGAINETNMAKVKKLISAASSPEIRAMADQPALTQTAKATKSESTAERLVRERLKAEGLTEKQSADKLKEYYAVTTLQLPTVLCKDGSEAAPCVLVWLLTAHETTITTVHYSSPDVVAEYRVPAIRPEAEEIIAELDHDSFQKALLKLADYNLGSTGRSKKMFLTYPICRYADEALLSDLCGRAPKWSSRMSGNDAPPLLTFRRAILFNNTRTALLFADKYKDLGDYAEIRGVNESVLRNQVLPEIEWDDEAAKNFDLGTKTVTAILNSDLSFTLRDNSTGQEIKSIPKRGADPEKYERAKEDFSKLKKTVRDIAGRRKTQLFQEFLSGEETDGADWKAAYLENPVLNMTARLLAWKQGDRTFTLTADGPIDSAGKPYAITDEPISVAHPMEMKADDLRQWQSYFVSQSLKQPFEQVWEPVIDPATILPDRYDGVEVSVFRFMHMEKHGITFDDYDFHNEIGFRLEGCSIDYERTNWHRHEIAKDETFTLGEFSFNKYTRQVNHIVALLDRWTVAGRVTKDDVSVREYLDQFTAAQIMEFIRLASENNCPNCTAMLLEYKQEHFPDIDPLAEFTLEE